ncbi:flagellar motor protein MotB [Clostridium septicum]|uniref:Chemotaxis protein MotB n=1 Tax=Clostridium septicum TaxID=1504 RepID=A0A9N7PKE8_CLOSE|nr:flagellar motor protein MotB [Clostridium septicum]AYE33421.1 chemotaxis protein MotB [Clostridium septicum]MDU1313969.1 OmpA family protein [Clostridium septicum]QAS61595.1 chemotaxis protein MotB [Clostridium septicum]UEC21968.1 OmpA family protein [Clostridium septicum]USS00001.1 OmpA family protein [Clostridium septicum]
MARRNKKIKVNDEPTGNEWLATYSDCITLLLTFFILLYSMSSVDNQKMQRLSNAFQTLMNGEKGNTIMEYDMYNGEVPLIGGEADIEVNVDEAARTEQQKMYIDVKKFVEENDLSSVVEIVDSERGVVIQLRDNILFETSSSSLREDSKGILDKINSLIASMDNPIIVEGHTDNRPIHTTEFPSNWELSADRAVNVVRYFVEAKGENPKRFTAAGYGEYRPVAPNDSYDNLAKNRRVNILIMSKDKE